MKLKRFATAAVVALASSALIQVPQAAQAHCASPAIEWDSTSLRIRAADSIPNGWTNAMKASASAWSGKPNANWRVSYVPPGFVGPIATPHVSAFRQRTAPPGWGGAPALVDLRTSGSRITGSHVHFNSRFTWNTNGTMNQAQRRADVRTIATHEFGHQVYLNHPSSCGAMTTAERNASMNPDWRKKWGTKPDDRAGLAVRK